MELTIKQRKEIFLIKIKEKYRKKIKIREIKPKSIKLFICDNCNRFLVNEEGWIWKERFALDGSNTLKHIVCKRCFENSEDAKEYFIREQINSGNWDWSYILNNTKYFKDYYKYI